MQGIATRVMEKSFNGHAFYVMRATESQNIFINPEVLWCKIVALTVANNPT